MAADIKTRTATTADTDTILEFLRVNFPRRKLYYENRQFFLNEFQADDNMLNFWLAADESSGELLAVSSYYPANTKDSPDIISGIWYAKDSGPVMLGFLLRREMLKHLNARFFLRNNRSREFVPLAPFLCQMDQPLSEVDIARGGVHSIL